MHRRALNLSLILALSLPAAALAQTPPPTVPPPPPPLSYGPPITLDQAQAMIARGRAAAAEAEWRMAIAIVEPSGELVAFIRMDDTQYGSITVAQRKAATAARYRMTTAALEERVQGGRLVTLANDDALPIAGGRPIVVDGRVIGAIGVSGASAAQDDQIASIAIGE